jgi:FKBP-type peptidyl-prolyl cis-trans isomerase
MKRNWVISVVVLGTGIPFASLGLQIAAAPGATPATMNAAPAAAQAPLFATQRDRVSYAMGVELARGYKRQSIDVDAELVARGLTDAMKGGQLLLSEEDILGNMNAFATQQRAAQGRARLVAALDSKKEGEEFLAANKAKPGVVTLPNGLPYKVLKDGNGPRPADTDTVECLYRGTLLNGTVFESTDEIGTPASLKVSQVIPGWREALKLMPVGSRWQIFIPSRLAYVERGVGRLIGPNATLVYEVELLSIK